jgi:hypothetical protein
MTAPDPQAVELVIPPHDLAAIIVLMIAIVALLLVISIPIEGRRK